ncbi:GntR family transcriptional regulator [Microvirga massiliensis]|uniref:GntR family transcriptional regulator n=1 Tax=Microvirga massiliensis TaxID=1033741 RepID=UPI00062B427B|nr:GntR family transcriptional regulator [Microvirga massiliensis]
MAGDGQVAAQTALGRGKRPQRLTEVAYQEVKRRILDNEYPPGSQILEQDIAAELDLSRTPVREALVRLEQDGLLSIVPRHGARISALSAADMREIYEILIALEPTAVELIARQRLAAEQLQPLVQSCDAMERSLEGSKPDLKAWAAADESFHTGVAQLCPNRRLSAMIMTVSDQSHRARLFTLTLRPLPLRSTQEHRAVVDAMLAGDADRARELYVAHRRRGRDELMALIERHGFQRL